MQKKENFNHLRNSIAYSKISSVSERLMKTKIACLFVFTFIFTFSISQTVQAAAGDLDPSFGNGGMVITTVGQSTSELAYALAIQADGKIIVVGTSQVSGSANQDALLIRYNTNGTLDDTFGSGGIVLTDISGANLADVIQAAAIQSDGKIVIAGSSFNGTKYNFVLARYNTDGALDSTFGNNGKVILSVGSGSSTAKSIAIQSDGKIIAAGQSSTAGNDNYTLVRFNINGTLDSTFGSGGIVTTDFYGFPDGANALKIQPDGKIVAAGYSFTNAGIGFQDLSLARYNPNGTLDTSFGTGGKLNIDLGSNSMDMAQGLAFQPDGKIIAVGNSLQNSAANFAAVRFNANGTLDTSFATNGIFKTPGGSLYGVVLQTDGKIIAGGTKIFRFNPNGTLDTSYGLGGIIDSRVSALAIQPDNKIIGSTDTGASNYDIKTSRYLSDSTARQTKFDFDGDGKADISVYRPSNGIWFLNQSQSGFSAVQFGDTNDKLVPADYDGDGRADIAVYRSGTWYLNRSQAGFLGFQFGASTDVPVPADYDGDGRAELAVWRPSNGVWYIWNLAANQFSAFQFGASTDKPVTGDYDGDGKSDIAVFRPSTGIWYIQGSQVGLYGTQFGAAEDKPVPADYDGDGKTDIAVWRPSNGVWYIQRPQAGFTSMQFGASTDLPVPADFDGDGKADIAVWRPSSGFWYVQQSGNNSFTGTQFGAIDDKPIPNAYVP